MNASRCRGAWRCGSALLFLLTVAGCASFAPRPPEYGRDLSVAAVPFLPQREHGCAPAALAMLFGARGIVATLDELTPLLAIPDRAGTLQPELLAQARRRGFIALTIEPDLAALAAELDAGRPVLVLQNNGLSWHPLWHYAVVVGYDAATDDMVLNSGVTERMHLARSTFDQTWQRGGRWGFVLLEPGELPIHADPARYASAVALMERGRWDDAVTTAEAAAALSEAPEVEATLAEARCRREPSCLAREIGMSPGD